MQTITSKDNPKLKAVRALVRSKKERQETSSFVMEGVRALSALVNGSGLPAYKLKEIWVSLDSPELAKDFDVPIYAVEHDVMQQLSDCCASQGILGVVEYMPEPLVIRREKGNYLLIDSLTDPGNLGTLIRSAVAFGFDGVFLYGDTVEIFNPKTVRATMGALSFCRFQTFGNHEGAGSACFQTLKKLGYDLIATVINDGEPLHETKFGLKNVLVVGNEAHGISAAIQKRATRQLSIPISKEVESLNAAVAGSICMYAICSAKN